MGIIFEPADLKGILATVYHGAQFFISDKNAVGNAYHDVGSNLSEYYEDVLPHDFLNALYKTVGQGKILEADLEPGDGVWNYPIYKFDLNWKQTGPTEASGNMRIFYANDEVEYDAVFSTQKPRQDLKYRDYELALKMPASWDGKNINGAIGGKWLGNSINTHPDALILSIDKGWRDNVIDYLEDDVFAANVNIELFKEIAITNNSIGSVVDFLLSAY